MDSNWNTWGTGKTFHPVSFDTVLTVEDFDENIDLLIVCVRDWISEVRSKKL